MCDESTVFGLVPEIGLRFRPVENFVVGIYARKYLLSDDIEGFVGRGLSIGFRF